MIDTAFVPLQSGSGAGGGLALLVGLALTVAIVAGYWKALEKAGEPGWAAIIPVYNLWVLVRASGNSWLWFVACLVPVVNLVATAKVFVNFAGQFGQGLVFGLATWLLPFVMMPLLGFGDYQYGGTAVGGRSPAV
ncbi:DUF5684 domain-containing protein [Halobacterium rubrum]|uniref:DUF5684 domain-containing protein n=1 Tax=Halobacterium TaxID=2239 RepID=UPI001F1C4657|nr:DUF5684 domain-containing protein [Halobacterium rubrum]MDH5019943.1 DUF5684 domain-containing protein [Halobacterium rubrum]